MVNFEHITMRTFLNGDNKRIQALGEREGEGDKYTFTLDEK